MLVAAPSRTAEQFSRLSSHRVTLPTPSNAFPAASPTATGAPPGTIYAGCSGWAYPQWKPDFYPPKTPAKKFLEHYAGRLNSVEVNYTFRQLPSRSTIDGWLAQVGPEFRFSFKAPQRITHIKRLNDCAEALSVFYTALRPVSAAGRMGLILFQLAPNFKADPAKLESFLRDAAPAEAGSLRVAFEFRHASWFTEEIYGVLRAHNAALCVAESDEFETPEVATASFSCYRFRKSEYKEEELAKVEARLQESATRGDVFAYFKHEDTPEGALNAESLLQRLRPSRVNQRPPAL
jgi:uncharacterized protein YecE (DUF72 family)